MKAVRLSELRPGHYINYNGETITKEKAQQIVAAGEVPVFYTVSDEYIQAALDDLSRARKAGEEPSDYCVPDPHAMRVIYWEIYKVDDNYIASVTRGQAVAIHLKAVGPDWYTAGEVPEVELVPAERNGQFEREDGRGYDEMTFGEWLADFKYTGPQVLCWNE